MEMILTVLSIIFVGAFVILSLIALGLLCWALYKEIKEDL